MKRILSALIFAVMASSANAQFVNGQVLTASQLNNAFAATLPLAGGTLTGPLTVPSLSVSNGTTFNGNVNLSANAPAFSVNDSAATNGSGVYLQTAGKNAWQLALYGPGAGSNFALRRYNPSTGAYIDDPFVVNVSSGAVTVNDGFSVGGGQLYPTAWGNHSYYNLIVPATAGWSDNVMTVQNNSANTSAQGNAAFRFADNVHGYERGAIGYSRVNTGTVGGWYPDLLYAEVGNQTAGDPDDTDFAVVVTHQAGTTYFPSTSLVAFRVVASTGDINMNTQGSGAVNVGSIGVPTEFTVGMQDSKARLRERDNVDNFSLTTNVNLAGNQDNTSLSSWELSMGATSDALQIGRMAPGAAATPSTLPNLLNLDKDGNISVKGRGIMPLYSTTGAGVNQPHMTTGSVALTSGSATVTFSGQVYTSASSYTCTANDTTAAAAVKVGQTSGTSVTFTGTSADTVQFMCAGF